MLQGRPTVRFAKLCARVARGISEAGQLALGFLMIKIGGGHVEQTSED